MPITFEVREHRRDKGVQVVDICLDGHVVATVYPGSDGSSIKITSPYITDTQIDIDSVGEITSSLIDVEVNDGVGSRPPFPWVRIIFQLVPYKIQGGELVKPN